MSYRIDYYSNGTVSITCDTCGRTSFNPGDVANLYCARCNRYHLTGTPRTSPVPPPKLSKLKLLMDD